MILIYSFSLRIRINMVPSIQSSSRSPRAPSHTMWRTPVASPLSSSHQTPISPYHHSPILRSPIAPYIQSPFTRPTLPESLESPGTSLPNSPVGFSGLIRSSPSSHRVCLSSRYKLPPSQFVCPYFYFGTY